MTADSVEKPRLEEGFLREVVAWRRDLHAHPELAFEEHRTSQKVAELLRSFGLEVETGIAGTGVVGSLRRGTSERSVALRADMDALPILEENTFDHCSTIPGKMHACGHDGHTAMLLGAARHLSETGGFDGTVRFVFQPAEERDGGARAMLNDGLFERFPAERVFGLHNMPTLDVGKFAIRSGPLMAAVDTFGVKLIGTGGHAAFPHQAVDPIVLAAQVVSALQTLVSRNVDPIESAVVSVTQIHGGDADNVIPQEVELGGTVRTFLPAIQDLIERRIEEVVAGCCQAFGAGFELDYERGYPATVNAPQETEVAAASAQKVGDEVIRSIPPVMGSEDFSFLLQARPGAFILAGNGDTSHLHTPNYDFNDELIPWGVSYWATLVRDQLPATG